MGNVIEEVYVWGPRADPPALYEKVWPRCAACQRPLRGDCVRIDGKAYHRRCLAHLPT